ncbi:MAG: hypothetical protein AB7E37_06920 [Candidatus Altimarinota bacterium]
MNEKRRTKYFIVNTKVEIEFFIIIIIALIPIALLFFHLNSRNEIINDFNNNKILTCTTRELILEVSKEDKYSVDGYYFLKGKTKLPVSKCEVKKDN